MKESASARRHLSVESQLPGAVPPGRRGPAAAGESHVNGWHHIERALAVRQLRQKDLAAALGVTSSAVSQIKTGRIKLNRRQIAFICGFLHLEAAAISGFYAEIIDARLCWEPLPEEADAVR